MRYERNLKLLPLANNLRKQMTKEERHLWYDFLRYCKPRFRRQEVIGNYIVDFFCYDAALALELDGSQHYDTQGVCKDAQRDEYLRSIGIAVLRFPNSDVIQNFSDVCEEIVRYLEDKGIHLSVSLPG